MFFCLIFILLFSESSYSLSKNEVRTFSKSNVWRNLLYFEDDKSIVTSERFFLSKSKDRNLLTELESTISAFQNNFKNNEGVNYSCIFTARAYVLNRRWPKSFPLKECKDYKKWKERLDAGKVYLVFSSVYPNNPASMFGHTFFRVDRKTKGSGQSEKAILGYSLAFQARTNNEDNPFTYTFKGLFGGYPAFLDIKPHYIDLGIYNNLESRDLWEYPLSLSNNEKELFLRLMWEISLTTSFDYYFFNKNCSTFLLKVLEIIRPQITFKNLNKLFVVPQEALKEIVSKFELIDVYFKPSIKRKISRQYLKLTEAQKYNFGESLNDTDKIQSNSDVNVLSLLVDYWKYKNYKEKLALNNNEKQLMFQSFLQRSKIKNRDRKYVFDSYIEKVRPNLAHHQSRFSARLGQGESRLTYRYGFHDFFDNPVGYDSSSYIKFIDTEFSLNREHIDIRIADILSLQDYLWHLPQLSWRGQLNFSKIDESQRGELNGLVGFSHLMKNSQFFSLTGASLQRVETNSSVRPVINIGYKYEIQNNFLIIMDYMYFHQKEVSEANKSYKLELKKSHKDINYLITLKERFSKTFFSIGSEIYF